MLMRSSLLLTSFATWLPHQKSNTSDDVLALAAQHPAFSPTWQVLRQLPVHRKRAIDLVLSRLEQLQPVGIICCGMAEMNTQMEVEVQAVCGDRSLQTGVNVAELVASLQVTGMSNDAGQFVCNDLYFGVLDYIRIRQLPIAGLFVHIPLLNPENTPAILSDFLQICWAIDCQSIPTQPVQN
jgi:pyroglutamyl-peptidase